MGLIFPTFIIASLIFVVTLKLFQSKSHMSPAPLVFISLLLRFFGEADVKCQVSVRTLHLLFVRRHTGVESTGAQAWSPQVWSSEVRRRPQERWRPHSAASKLCSVDSDLHHGRTHV